MPDAFELPLVGAKGEPVDFARTIVSHGVAELPPNRLDLAGRALETTLPARGPRERDAGKVGEWQGRTQLITPSRMVPVDRRGRRGSLVRS